MACSTRRTRIVVDIYKGTLDENRFPIGGVLLLHWRRTTPPQVGDYFRTGGGLLPHRYGTLRRERTRGTHGGLEDAARDRFEEAFQLPSAQRPVRSVID